MVVHRRENLSTFLDFCHTKQKLQTSEGGAGNLCPQGPGRDLVSASQAVRCRNHLRLEEGEQPTAHQARAGRCRGRGRSRSPTRGERGKPLCTELAKGSGPPEGVQKAPPQPATPESGSWTREGQAPGTAHTRTLAPLLPKAQGGQRETRAPSPPRAHVRERKDGLVLREEETDAECGLQFDHK